MKIHLPYKINFSTDDYYAEHDVLRSDLKLYREASDDLAAGRRKLRSVKTLQSLVEKYPDCPMFLNQLIGAYEGIGDEENLEINANKLWEKFPDFLIGKINKASDLLFKNVNPDVILESVFGGITSLEKLYPERKMFYAVEVLNFHFLIAELYLEKGENQLALLYARVAEQIDPSNERVQLLMDRINYAKNSDVLLQCDENCNCDDNDATDDDVYIPPNEEKKEEKIVFVNKIDDKK